MNGDKKEILQLAGLGVEELNNLLVNAKKELLALRLKRTSDELKDTSVFSKKKKEVAQILTALNKLKKVNQ